MCAVMINLGFIICTYFADKSPWIQKIKELDTKKNKRIGYMDLKKFFLQYPWIHIYMHMDIYMDTI